jgi:hypothetical protein
MFSSTQTQSTEFKGRSPFAAVALAGHTMLGGWCECGSSAACICDPGETPNSIRRQAITNNSEPPDEPINEPNADLGSIALIFAFMALTLFRLRA